MIQLLDNIYAVPVSTEAYNPFITYNEGYEIYYLNWCIGREDGDYIQLDGDYDILGTCTAKEIDFDVSMLSKENEYIMDPIFRGILTSKGILFENPLGDRRPSFNNYSSLISYQGDCKEYDKSQKNVVEKIVIIKRL